MCSMTAGFLTNVVLDALFISVFRWGTAGAAAATVIAQGVSAALGLVYLFRVKRVFRGVSFRLNRRTVLRLLATSLSPFGLTMLNTVTLVVINRGALAYGGSLAGGLLCGHELRHLHGPLHHPGHRGRGAAPSQPVLRRRRTGGAGSGPYTDLPFRPRRRPALRHRPLSGAVRHPPPVWGIQCRYPGCSM